MKCPRCGSRTGISDSRLRQTNEVHRRRFCKDKRCGHRFTTREMAADAMTALRAEASSYQKVAKAVLRGRFCSECGAVAAIQCDRALPAGAGRNCCDRWLCDDCAHPSLRSGGHYCPEHHREAVRVDL
jgi:hypothetical protein